MTVNPLQKKRLSAQSTRKAGKPLTLWQRFSQFSLNRVFHFPMQGLQWLLYVLSPPESGDRSVSKLGSPVVPLASKFYFLWHRSILVFSHTWFERIFFQVFLTSPQTQHFIRKKRKEKKRIEMKRKRKQKRKRKRASELRCPIYQPHVHRTKLKRYLIIKTMLLLRRMQWEFYK